MPEASRALENTELSPQQSWANQKIDHCIARGHLRNNVVALVPNKTQFQYGENVGRNERYI